MILYHGSQEVFAEAPRDFFKDHRQFPEGIHLGTVDQAIMRAPKGTILEVKVLASRRTFGA